MTGRRYIFLVVGFLMVTVFKGYCQKRYNIVDFGAKADGTTLCSKAIQQAIDKASVKGGIVLIPPGRFLTGTIFLKSGVSLLVQKDAVLLGSINPEQYQIKKNLHALIIAEHQTNISILGKGTIDGQGLKLALVIDSLHHAGVRIDSAYNYKRMRPGTRPKIIDMALCKDVVVRQVTIMNSSSWVQNYDQCENILIDSIKVNSVAFWNNDGIDVSDSKHVTIKNCSVNSADDGICLKSEQPDKLNEDISITNCTVRSSANAVKFGTSSRGGFRNIRIENIYVYDTYRSAIALESVDGGILEDVVVNNVEAVNTGNAILLRLGHRNKDSRNGTLRNISIRNVKVQIPFTRPDEGYDLRGQDLPFFHNPFPASITGIPGQHIENVTLEDIELSYPGRATKGMAYVPVHRLDQVPERQDEYPEFSMFGELPSWAFYVRHVDGISMKNITLKLNDADFRPAFVFDDVTKVKLTEFRFPKNQTTPGVVLQRCRDINVIDKNIIELMKTVEPKK